MKQILFIMFQGLATTLKHWNEYTESHFLDRLKELGSVYTYQDKMNNIYHYRNRNGNGDNNDNINNDINNYTADYDIDIDLSYLRCNTHIKLVYDDILNKYKNIDDYILIPIGFSIGGYMALYFAQHYKDKHTIKQVITLDTSGYNPNISIVKNKLQEYEKFDYIKDITNAKYKHILEQLKHNKIVYTDSHTDQSPYTDQLISILTNIHIYVRLLSAVKYLKLEFSIPVTSFINIETDNKTNLVTFQNKTKLEEIELLKKDNPDTFTSIIFTNKTHYIFNKIQPAKQIIKYIKNLILI